MKQESEESQKCLVCGREVPFESRQLWLFNGTSVCMNCEFREIDVWHVALPGEPENGYYDVEIKHIIDVLNGCDSGDSYIITKKSMKATKYFGLPEFSGF